MDENKFNFKFLNRMMYIFAIVIVIFALKELGILAKLGEVLKALTPLYIGIVVCWISKPLANRIHKMGVNSGISAVISLVIIFALIAIALCYFIPVMVTQISSFLKDVPQMYTQVATNVNEFIATRFNTTFRLATNLSDLDVSKYVDFENLLNYSIDTVSALGSLLVSFVTSIMLSFFMVKDMDKSKSSLILFFSKGQKDSKRYKMLKEMDETLDSYFRGLIIDSLVVGTLTVILCLILRFKYALIFGIIIMLLNFIPYIGAAISYAIMAIYALTVGGPVTAVITLLCSFGIQILDANVLQPNIIGKSVHLHPVIVICGLLVFGDLFGIVGMLLAVPVLALVKVFIKYKFDIHFEDDDVKKKKKIGRKKDKKEEIEVKEN